MGLGVVFHIFIFLRLHLLELWFAVFLSILEHFWLSELLFLFHSIPPPLLGTSVPCMLDLFNVSHMYLSYVFHYFCSLYWICFSVYFLLTYLTSNPQIPSSDVHNRCPSIELLISLIVFFCSWISDQLFLIDSSSLWKFCIWFITFSWTYQLWLFLSLCLITLISQSLFSLFLLDLLLLLLLISVLFIGLSG